MIRLNHTIVPSKDKKVAAQFFADLFDLEVSRKSPGSRGRFSVVQVGDINFDFDEWKEFEPHHYAFHVSDEEFDEILGRVKEQDITYAADPVYEKVGGLNSNEGGRGFYFRTPDGHNLELLTRI